MRTRNERGSGLIGSFFGAVVFLAFLSLATHTLISLYATSVITAVAWDDARKVASNPEAQTAAEADLRTQLDGFKNLEIEWRSNDSAVGLNVSADRPMLLPRALAEATQLNRINRTVWVRSEELQ